jgi:hypothetical protein
MRRWVQLAAVVAIAGCSWTRFDDLEENASVLVLKQPSGLSGFGAALATAADGNRVLVLVAGGSKTSSGAAVFELGQGQDASLDAFDIGQCNTNDCVLARTVAALPVAQSPSGLAKSACWVTGFQKQPAADPGLAVSCTETGTQRFIYTLSLPATVDADQDELNLASESLPTVGSPPAATALIAGIPKLGGGSSGAAVGFAPASTAPINLVPATNAETFGAAVAVLRTGGTRRFLVGAPDRAELWVFDESGQELGCLSSDPGFARTLATGDVDGDGAEDVVAATAGEVRVLRGSAIATLSQPGACQPLEASDVLVTLRCRASSDVDGCPGGFGDAIAVGDIDGDGDGEVAVGAPQAKVRGAGAAGAVYVFDAEIGSANPEFVTEERFLASAGSGDRMGSSVAFAPQKGRHLLVAGAPGAGKVAIFYCSRLLSSNQRGKRCK